MFSTSLIKKFVPLRKVKPDTSTGFALVPSKLVEMTSPVSLADKSSWRFQTYLHVTPEFTKKILWILLPVLAIAFFNHAGATIDQYGLMSLFRFTFIFQIACVSAFLLVIGTLFGLMISCVRNAKMVYLPFPSKLFLSDEGFAPWDASCLIPWSNIRSVKTRQLIFKGKLLSTVLEIDADYKNKSFLKRLERRLKTDGLRTTTHFFDPLTRSIPEEKGPKNYLRIPLELFAFEHDKQKFLAALRENVEPGSFICNVELASDSDAISANSFTQLWLTDLRGVDTNNSARVLEAGRELKKGEYQIKGVLGYGSYSVVYAANSKNSTAVSTVTVAIKELVLNSGGTRASKEAILKHVLAEVEILRKIDHPNIVKCLDFFVENGKIYVVLEGIIASNLRELTAQTGKWDEQSIISATLQCCSILAYLHGLPVPIIHRDFTPDNLILDLNNDSIKLIDFNVAEEANANSSQTIVGKQCYMAPEQWCGQFTPAGDLYQLGCTMYFLATALEPEPLTQANLPASLGLSNRLSAIIKKLTEREVTDRYTSALELANDVKLLDQKYSQELANDKQQIKQITIA